MQLHPYSPTHIAIDKKRDAHMHMYVVHLIKRNCKLCALSLIAYCCCFCAARHSITFVLLQRMRTLLSLPVPLPRPASLSFVAGQSEFWNCISFAKVSLHTAVRDSLPVPTLLRRACVCQCACVRSFLHCNLLDF